MTVYALGDRAPQFPDSGNYWIAPDAHCLLYTSDAADE